MARMLIPLQHHLRLETINFVAENFKKQVTILDRESSSSINSKTSRPTAMTITFCFYRTYCIHLALACSSTLLGQQERILVWMVFIEHIMNILWIPILLSPYLRSGADRWRGGNMWNLGIGLLGVWKKHFHLM